MSVAAIKRSFTVIHYLQSKGTARFTDLAHLLSPISRTALSHLLASLKEVGELEQIGRLYRLAPDAAALSSNDGSTYSLPPALLTRTHTILQGLTEATGHSCAIFARVGTSTMKIMDTNNLPAPRWPFASLGSEWPLVPVHGFARIFLAHSSETAARSCYRTWQPYLQPNPKIRLAESEQAFLSELAKIRRQGHAIEYKDEIDPIMRVVLPISLLDEGDLRFAVGIVASFIYLLEVNSCIESLRSAATQLAGILKGRVPISLFGEGESAGHDNAWTFDSIPTRTVSQFRAPSSRRPALVCRDQEESALAAG